MKRRSWLERRLDEDSDFAERFDREIKAARKRTAERIAARNLAAAYDPRPCAWPRPFARGADR